MLQDPTLLRLAGALDGISLRHSGMETALVRCFHAAGVVVTLYTSWCLLGSNGVNLDLVR